MSELQKCLSGGVQDSVQSGLLQTIPLSKPDMCVTVVLKDAYKNTKCHLLSDHVLNLHNNCIMCIKVHIADAFSSVCQLMNDSF